MLVRTSESGLKSQSLVSKKSGPFTQPLFFRASAVIQRVPGSAGSSPLDKWSYSSIVVESRISETRIATKTGSLLVEFNHCSTVVLSVHMYELSIFMFKDFLISSLRRLASNAACNSSLGIERISIGATLAFPKTKICDDGATAQENNRAKDVLRAVTTHLQFYLLNRVVEETARNC